MKDDFIIVSYVEDYLIFSKNKQRIKYTLIHLRSLGFVFTGKGFVDQYLGIQIKNNDDSSITISRPFLLRRIIETLPGLKDANPASIPGLSTVLLTKDTNGKSIKGFWNYRSMIGMLNFLSNSTHPELAYSVHQCARFCENPKYFHEMAVHQIVKYVLSIAADASKFNKSFSKFKGMIHKPDHTKGFDVFVDASFAWDWNKVHSE